MVVVVDGYSPSLENLPQAVLKSGDYGAEVIYTKEKQVICRFRVYASLINI